MKFKFSTVAEEGDENRPAVTIEMLDAVVKASHADSRERAEAFLRALNLWEEECPT